MIILWKMYCNFSFAKQFLSQAMKQKEDKMALEIEIFKQKINELEKLCKERGLSGYLNIRSSRLSEGIKPGSSPA